MCSSPAHLKKKTLKMIKRVIGGKASVPDIPLLHWGNVQLLSIICAGKDDNGNCEWEGRLMVLWSWNLEVEVTLTKLSDKEEVAYGLRSLRSDRFQDCCTVGYSDIS